MPMECNEILPGIALYRKSQHLPTAINDNRRRNRLRASGRSAALLDRPNGAADQHGKSPAGNGGASGAVAAAVQAAWHQSP